MKKQSSPVETDVESTEKPIRVSDAWLRMYALVLFCFILYVVLLTVFTKSFS